MKKNNYRTIALAAYPENQCVHCGFGHKDILEVAHLDQNRANNSIENLAILCPNCHKMLDIGLIPVEVILQMRVHKKETKWSLRMKDAAVKAGATRMENNAKKKRSIAAHKAVATRKSNASGIATKENTVVDLSTPVPGSQAPGPNSPHHRAPADP